MGRHDDQAAWEHLLDDLKPDIALLQETTPPRIAFDRGELAYGPAYEHLLWGSAVFTVEGRVSELPLPPEHRGFLIAAEVAVPNCPPLVAVSVHAKIVDDYVRPNLDHAFMALAPFLEHRRYIVGGDFNLSRNWDKTYGTTHHTQFLDEFLIERGFVNAHRKFHAEEEQTFWGHQTRNSYQDDHVFVSPDLDEDRLSGCDVVPRIGHEHLSDHSPLQLSVNLS
jgi:endonuclease/exonuclease/phosphatase family metal-dependent hydrolase